MAAVNTPTRLSYGAVAAGIGGILLIISLFLDWFGEGPFGLNAWDFFSITDIILLLIGIAAIVFAVVEAGRMQLTLPFNRVRVLTILGIVATTIVWVFILEGDHQKFGIFLAGLSSLAILAGGILAERSPELTVDLGGRGGGRPVGLGGPPPGGQPQGFAQPPQAQPAQPAGGPPQQQAAPQGGQAKADWYPDPRGEKRLRYYDGTQWTEHTAD